MKNTTIALSLSLILAACGGGGGHSGSTGPQGAPGKSAYDIWLEQGNVGTEQDYLDSLVSGGGTNSSGTSGNDGASGPGAPSFTDVTQDTKIFKNTRDWLKFNKYNYTETTNPWFGHNGFKQYVYRTEGSTNIGSTDYIYTYNEKELTLGNYGVYLQSARGEFSTHDTMYASGYIHNRNGAGANVYTPDAGTVFKGGTLAYLHGSAQAEPVLLTGNGTFTYSPSNPTLELKFDDYYTFKLDKHDIQYGGQANVSIKGENLTGINAYDLQTGDYNVLANYLFYGWGSNAGFVQANGVAEAFVNYGVDFYTSDNRYAPSINSNFNITGAFGGEKQ